MKSKFFEIAKTASKLSDHSAHKLGAVIVKKNKIISIGFNKKKTHTKSNHPWKGLHAEVCAIIKTKKDLIGCTIYVYRETKLGRLATAKPCPSCFLAIKKTGIKEICYTTESGYIKEEV